GGEARGVVSIAGQRLEREQAALARRAATRTGWPCGGILLRNRVPLAAGIATALPAAIGSAAVLADETRDGTGHVRPKRSRAGNVKLHKCWPGLIPGSRSDRWATASGAHNAGMVGWPQAEARAITRGGAHELHILDRERSMK